MEKAITLAEWERQIRLAKGRTVQSVLVIGQALQAISEGRLWAQSGADSFNQYVEMEHGFKRSWAFSLIGVYVKLGPILIGDESLQEVDVTRLTRLLPYIKDGNAEEMVHAASQIPDAKGFDNYIKSLGGGQVTDDHEHEFEPVGYEACSICGQKRKVEIKPAIIVTAD